RVGRELFDSMFSFAIIRNPFDQLVSHYLYIQTYPGHHNYQASMSLDFSDFIQRKTRTDLNFTRTQLSKVTDRNGEMLVKKLYRFENYSDILPDVLARIGLPPPEETPHEKQSARKPYQEYYDDRARALVEKHFRADLDAFGYSFDD
ncbi:MAG: sulfotransferase family 2 domain-containing protein, partial [Pseudomonadota bacterium]